MSFVNKDNITSIIQGSNGVKDALNQKANTDGYYETLTAGTSEQLLSTVQIEDKVPYNFRTSGGSVDIGNRLTDKIVGGTICWNQILDYHNFAESDSDFVDGIKFTNNNDGSVKIEIAEGGATSQRIFNLHTTRLTLPNVKIYGGVCGINGITICNAYSPTSAVFSDTIYNNTYTRTQQFRPAIRVASGTNAGTYTLYPQCFNLTQTFGAAIADHYYSLEQSTAGAGIAWFKNLFPKDYYAYNAGEMLSVNVSSHDTVGFNAYDNASGKAKLAGGMEYQITGAYTALAYSTGETITPDTDGYFTPSESGELTVTGGNATDTCVHLVWDGEKDGEFEEYIKHSYPLDSSLVLQGVPMLDANNKLYYDGDIYESDGTVTRRAVEATFDGSEDWKAARSQYNEYQYFRLAVGDYGSAIANICISDKLSQAAVALSNTLKGINVTNSSTVNRAIIIIRPENVTDFTSIAQFKTWLAANPVTVIYLLSDAYATTETADPYQNPQIIDDFGTEEYVDYAYSQGTRDVAIPVGHDTLYMNNLRAKLEMSPDSPDGDGDYIVRQSGGENTYVPLTKELPTTPTEDGNYVLKVTVANGTPTYSWETQA